LISQNFNAKNEKGNSMKNLNLVSVMALLVMASLPSGQAAEPTAEMRTKMAGMHQMMADCLKSDKPISECKQQMMKDCPMMKETGHCPMMGEMDAMMKGEHTGHGKGKKDDKDNAHL
jgi:hypothetical protein